MTRREKIIMSWWMASAAILIAACFLYQYPRADLSTLNIFVLFGCIIVLNLFFGLLSKSAHAAAQAEAAARRAGRICKSCNYPREGLSGEDSCPECGAAAPTLV